MLFSGHFVLPVLLFLLPSLSADLLEQLLLYLFPQLIEVVVIGRGGRVNLYYFRLPEVGFQPL